MSAYIGKFGQLIKTFPPSGESISSESRSSFKTTLGGRVMEQRGPRGRREWSMDVASAYPEEMAAFEALDLGVLGKPPWVWVPPNAQSQNLFAPEASVMASGSYLNTLTPGGSVVADDGVLVPATASTVPNGYITFGNPGGVPDPIPVVPGLPLTVSAYAAGQSSLTLTFRSVTGSTLSSFGIAFGATMSRRSLTKIAPVGAVDAVLRVWAGPSASVRAGNPAATWTSTLMPWSVGRGCNKVTVEGFSEVVNKAIRDAPRGYNRSSFSFTVKELG